MENDYNIDEIEAYLNQEMTEVEQTAFEGRMQGDKALAEEVRFHRAVVGGIDLAGELNFKELVGEVHNELKQEQFLESAKTVKTQEAKVRKIRFSSRRILSLAASFAILLMAAWWLFLRPVSSEQLYASYFELPSEVLSTEIESRLSETGFGTNKVALEQLETAIQAYQNSDYETAIEGFQTFKNTAPEDALVNYASFYEAISSLKLEKTQISQDLLQDVYEDPRLQEEALWYLAMTYLKKDKKEEAKYVLLQLEKEGKYQKRATKLLKKIK